MAKISLIENHPIYHDFYRFVDYVYERNSRNRLIVIKRVFDCSACNTKRIWLINIDYWEVVSRSYKYDRTQKIVRIGKSEWLKKLITESTTDDIRAELRP
jgi:hypothetical protein